MIGRRMLAGTALLAALPGPVLALAGTDATPHEVLVALGTGKTVLVEFYGIGCSSCAAQDEVIGALKANSPGLAEAVTFLSVDFDAHGGSELAKALTVTESGTLIVLKGGTEFGRLVQETSAEEIRGLVQKAFSVAKE